MDKWELFSHDADIGIRGIGSTLEKAFEMAAMALTGVVIDPDSILGDKIIDLEIEEQPLDFLFYEWINHIIYEMDTKKMIFNHYHVTIMNQKLLAKLKGEEVKNIKGDFAVEIKGATLSELKVFKENNNWIAQCIVDI